MREEEDKAVLQELGIWGIMCQEKSDLNSCFSLLNQAGKAQDNIIK